MRRKYLLDAPFRLPTTPTETQLLAKYFWVLGDRARLSILGLLAGRERSVGSPTIRVNGRDVEPGAETRTDCGLKCRLYQSAGGVSGQPPEEWLRAAVGGATGAVA